jgi:hypothetical protein
MGPATGYAQLEVPSGAFELEVVAGKRSDLYSMRVSDSIVTVTPAAGRFSSFTTPAFHRAPRNSLALRCTVPWVSTSPDTTQRFVCRDVARMLVDSLGAREFSFGSGAGWPFHAVEEGQPALRYFHYAEPEDWRRAYDLLQGYSHRTMARLAPNARVELQNHCSRLAVLRIWAGRLEGQVGWSPGALEGGSRRVRDRLHGACCPGAQRGRSAC